MTKSPIETDLWIARKVIRKALAKGYNISVMDGDDYPVKRSTSFKVINEALASTDSDSLIIRDASANRIGFILLIWGNGEDVVSDHTDKPEINELVNDTEEA